MFTLSRYIVREHIGPFLFSFFVITLFFLLNILFRELGRLTSRGLEFFVILEYFILHMGWIVAITLPMAVLPAVLMAFGRLSSDNEITAIKANGVSLYRVIIPVLVAATILCGVCIWFNNHVLPDMNHRARLLTSDIARKRPTLTLEPGVVSEVSPYFHITVREIEESEGFSKVRGVFVDDYSTSNVTQTILADSGEIRFDKSLGALIIDLYDGEIQKIDYNKPEEIVRIAFPHYRLVPSVPGLVLSRSDSEYRGDREKSAGTMLAEVRQENQMIEQQWDRIKKLLAPPFGDRLVALIGNSDIRRLRPEHINEILSKARAKKTIPDTTGQSAEISLSQLESKNLATIRNALNNIKSNEKKRSKLMVEVHKKYSIPAACLVFVLIGAPLGILARRGGMAVGGGMSLFFFLLYWTLLIGGEELADRQIITPFLAMWSANILVGAAGLYLVIRSATETTWIHIAPVRRLAPRGEHV